MNLSLLVPAIAMCRQISENVKVALEHSGRAGSSQALEITTELNETRGMVQKLLALKLERIMQGTHILT